MSFITQHERKGRAMIRFLVGLVNELLPVAEPQVDEADEYRERMHRLNVAHWHLTQQLGREPSVSEVFAEAWGAE